MVEVENNYSKNMEVKTKVCKLLTLGPQHLPRSIFQNEKCLWPKYEFKMDPRCIYNLLIPLVLLLL